VYIYVSVYLGVCDDDSVSPLSCICFVNACLHFCAFMMYSFCVLHVRIYASIHLGARDTDIMLPMSCMCFANLCAYFFVLMHFCSFVCTVWCVCTQSEGVCASKKEGGEGRERAEE